MIGNYWVGNYKCDPTKTWEDEYWLYNVNHCYVELKISHIAILQSQPYKVN